MALCTVQGAVRNHDRVCSFGTGKAAVSNPAQSSYVFHMACNGSDLDLYVVGALREPETAALEEHLLVCGRCCDELDVAVGFAQGMREVSHDLRFSANHHVARAGKVNHRPFAVRRFSTCQA